MTSPQSYVFRSMVRPASRLMGWHADRSLGRFRAFMAALSKYTPLPHGIAIVPVIAGGVPAEWVRVAGGPIEHTILYLHGGGFTLGWFHGQRPMVAGICQASHAQALVVDYRLAPEHPFPAALEDSISAYRWLLEQGVPAQSIVLIGDSAGGNLILTALVALRDSGDPLPAAAVGISPITDLAATGRTYQTNRRRDVVLTPASLRAMMSYYAGARDPRLAALSPLYANLEGLPPLLIQVGAHEILLSDARRFALGARAAGDDVTLQVWKQMWHVWHLYTPYLPEARHAIASIGVFIRQHALTYAPPAG